MVTPNLNWKHTDTESDYFDFWTASIFGGLIELFIRKSKLDQKDNPIFERFDYGKNMYVSKEFYNLTRSAG